MYNLGCMYYSGRQGAEESLAEARKWFKKAASQGNKAAINFLKQLDTYEGSTGSTTTTTTSSRSIVCTFQADAAKLNLRLEGA